MSRVAVFVLLAVLPVSLIAQTNTTTSAEV